MRLSLLLCLLPAVLLLGSCTSNEITQWRGPARNGIYPDKNLLNEWPADGPELELSIANVGKGLSQPLVYNNKIYITGIKHDTLDVLSVYDWEGSLLWEKDFSRSWPRTYPESRGTPTIEDNRIYLIGGDAALVCLNAGNGELIWKQNPHSNFSGKYQYWGIVESVLLTDNAALYVTGGEETTVVAYHKKTGELLWKSESTGGPKSYASSALVEWGGLQIALIQTANDIIGIDVSNGDVLWTYNTIQYHTEKGDGEAANTPLFYNGELFITYGNEQPGMLFTLADDARSISLKWTNDILDTHHGGLVLLDGVIYASNMIDNTRGNWAAVDWQSGQTLWEEKWHTKGSVIAADGMLYFYEEKQGNIALVQPDRTRLKVVSTFQMKDGQGPHWAHPSIYNKHLLVRHGNVLNIYSLKGE
ncbi:PQQ-binding-like beta-propeller repeat protein [Draconibacterium mangrovi]|uniref:PQQ-binding-like beta-propeller repeat protein n=2 Tax=Draconibacterium TaxID=1471399 RepID=UPI0013D269D4|nr:PQQ-binding-like beta-propeller repeat protein [Draconibacterium mangrovi]